MWNKRKKIEKENRKERGIEEMPRERKRKELAKKKNNREKKSS